MPLSIRAIWHLFAWAYRQVKRLDARIDALESKIQKKDERQDRKMAVLDDKIAAIQQDVLNVKTLVDGLRQDIENGVPQAALDKLDDIDKALDAIAPDPVEPPV